MRPLAVYAIRVRFEPTLCLCECVCLLAWHVYLFRRHYLQTYLSSPSPHSCVLVLVAAAVWAPGCRRKFLVEPGHDVEDFAWEDNLGDDESVQSSSGFSTSGTSPTGSDAGSIEKGGEAENDTHNTATIP